MQKLLAYIKEVYAPLALIVYGSFADGSNCESSDFDALAITSSGARLHDTSTVDGTVLDLFLYPAAEFVQPYDPEEFLQVWDGIIVFDTGGIAAALVRRVCEYIENCPRKSAEENQAQVAWCAKMLRRALRGDTEGYYRLHFLLADSLGIYCDLKGYFFSGPRKALQQMQCEDAASAACYALALQNPSPEHLTAWIDCLQELADG